MHPEQLIAQALRLPDEVVYRHSFEPGVPLDAEIVFDFGPIMDRRARAFNALHELLTMQYGEQYGNVDVGALLPGAYQEMIELQCSIRLLESLVEQRLSALYYPQMPTAFRKSTVWISIAAQNHAVIVRLSEQTAERPVLVIDLRRRAEEQAPTPAAPAGDSMPTHIFAMPPTDRRKLN